MNQQLIVCHKCLHENEEGRDFCEKCGAPIGVYTTLSPFKRIYAAGHTYREASSNPTRPIVVIGVWLIFAPGAVLLLYSLFEILAERAWSQEFAWFLCYGAISVALLSKTTINFIKNKKAKAMPRLRSEDAGS